MPSAKLDIAQLRMRNGRLVGPPLATAAEVVGWLGAVQAQDYGGAKWAVAQRMAGALDRDVEAAFARGEIVRTHVLRPTWHFVLPSDVRWMLALTGPRIKRAMAPYDRKVGLDERTLARSTAAIAAALAGGKHLMRSELAGALAKAKIATAGRLNNLIVRAELDAVICNGPRRGKQATYALVSERCPAAAPLERDEALGALASRYFASHGPALVHDFGWWSGLTMSDASRAIELARPVLASRAQGGRTYWFREPARSARLVQPIVHLLPNYDEYMVAYRHRERALDGEPAGNQGWRSMLIANHLVVLNGTVIGTWKKTVSRSGIVVTAALTGKLARRERSALDAAVARLGEYFELPAELARRA